MDDFTDPIANMVRGAQYLQDRFPEWFDKNYSVWVDSSNQARQAKENSMSTKKISAGDTLTVGDLTGDYLGAVIEVGPMSGVTYRFRLNRIERDDSRILTMRTVESGIKCAHRHAPVTVITPPPVVQPDEPTIVGQCIRIKGDDEFRGVVADPGSVMPIVDHRASWRFWGDVLRRAGERQIIVSDPPRWPDETPEVPERIKKGKWPDDDTHLRDWEWIDADDDPWWWDSPAGLWRSEYLTPDMRRPLCGPWTRGNRVEAETGPKAGDVFTRIEDMPYGWVAKVTFWDGESWGHVVRYDNDPTTHLWNINGSSYESVTLNWQECGLGTRSGGGYGLTRYTLVETEDDYNSRVAQGNS